MYPLYKTGFRHLEGLSEKIRVSECGAGSKINVQVFKAESIKENLKTKSFIILQPTERHLKHAERDLLPELVAAFVPFCLKGTFYLGSSWPLRVLKILLPDSLETRAAPHPH
ncbi:uncharacterized protein LOC118535392 [Halichoerus grypus]